MERLRTHSAELAGKTVDVVTGITSHQSDG
jgi:hypothetical protein